MSNKTKLKKTKIPKKDYALSFVLIVICVYFIDKLIIFTSLFMAILSSLFALFLCIILFIVIKNLIGDNREDKEKKEEKKKKVNYWFIEGGRPHNYSSENSAKKGLKNMVHK